MDIGRSASHRQLDTRFGAGLLLLAKRHAAGETLYGVDVHALFGQLGSHVGNLPCGQASAEQSDNPAVFVLTAYPFLIFLNRYRCKADVDIQFGGLEEQFLHDVARHGRVSLDEDAERKGVMYVGLADVENTGIVAG